LAKRFGLLFFSFIPSVFPPPFLAQKQKGLVNPIFGLESWWSLSSICEAFFFGRKEGLTLQDKKDFPLGAE